MTTDKVVTGVLMLGEMLEQPKVLADSIKLWGQDISAICSVLPEKIQGVVFIGRGSSDNAATIGRYAVEAFTGIPASLAAPSLSTRYAPHTSYVDYVIVARRDLLAAPFASIVTDLENAMSRLGQKPAAKPTPSPDRPR